MSLKGTRSVVAASLIAAAALVPTGTAGAASSRSSADLPSLRTTARGGDGKQHAVTVGLPLLSRADFRIVRRPSAASITVGYPATRLVRRHGRRVRVRARPCALSTFRLKVVPGATDPLAVAGTGLPDAQREAVLRSIRGATTTIVGAWRTRAQIVNNSRVLKLRGIHASRVTLGPTPAVSILTLEARTVRQDPTCVTSNRYTVGPRILDSLERSED